MIQKPTKQNNMKRKITIALIIFAAPFMLHAQVTYRQFFDGADTSVNNSLFVKIDTSSSNVWQIGSPQKDIFDVAATIPNAIVTDTLNYYPVNNTSSFSLGILPELFGRGIFALQWKQKLDFDSQHDGGIVEFSTDNGVTWDNVFGNPYVYDYYGYNIENIDTLPSGEYAFSGTDTLWKDIWLCFDASWMLSLGDSVFFRYTLKSDSIDNSKEGWLIDNFLAHLTIIHTVDNNAEQEAYIKVYPNPTTGKVNISVKKKEGFHIIEKIELVDVKGKVVQKWGESPTKFFVDISDHPNGVYFLNIKTNKGFETFKVVLER